MRGRGRLLPVTNPVGVVAPGSDSITAIGPSINSFDGVKNIRNEVKTMDQNKKELINPLVEHGSPEEMQEWLTKCKTFANFHPDLMNTMMAQEDNELTALAAFIEGIGLPAVLKYVQLFSVIKEIANGKYPIEQLFAVYAASNNTTPRSSAADDPGYEEDYDDDDDDDNDDEGWED